jgi:hypothetical protein
LQKKRKAAHLKPIVLGVEFFIQILHQKKNPNPETKISEFYYHKQLDNKS